MALSDICSDFAVYIEAEFPGIEEKAIANFKFQVNDYRQLAGSPGACNYDPAILNAIDRIVDRSVLDGRWFWARISLEMIAAFYNTSPGSPHTKTNAELVNWLNVTHDMM